jgi:asparagine synthase (glutamine-hydrolysing)
MDWVEEVDRALRKSVSEIGVRDESVIAFSGGLDSSLLAVFIPDVPLYSVAVKGSEDERWVIEAAEMMGREVNLVNVDVDEDILIKVMNIIGSPNPLDVSLAIPLYILGERVASDGHKYIITGQGADELFGGYARYRTCPKEELMRIDFEKVVGHDIQRDKKVIGVWGCKLIAPYLHPDIVKTAFSIPVEMKVSGE